MSETKTKTDGKEDAKAEAPKEKSDGSSVFDVLGKIDKLSAADQERVHALLGNAWKPELKDKLGKSPDAAPSHAEGHEKHDNHGEKHDAHGHGKEAHHDTHSPHAIHTVAQYDEPYPKYMPNDEKILTAGGVGVAAVLTEQATQYWAGQSVLAPTWAGLNTAANATYVAPVLNSIGGALSTAVSHIPGATWLGNVTGLSTALPAVGSVIPGALMTLPALYGVGKLRNMFRTTFGFDTEKTSLKNVRGNMAEGLRLFGDPIRIATWGWNKVFPGTKTWGERWQKTKDIVKKIAVPTITVGTAVALGAFAISELGPLAVVVLPFLGGLFGYKGAKKLMGLDGGAGHGGGHGH